MKNSLTGFGLALQFFTAIPVRKQFDMNTRSVTWMYGWLPVIGLLMGAILAGILQLCTMYTDVTPLFLAIVLVIAMFILTGGLHLDGWVDMSDAYFSYGDKEKRLEILDDPRTGAFGAISLVCLVLLKIGVIFEALQQDPSVLIPFFICIPMLARMAIQLYFLTMKTSKDKGLAAYFKKTVNANGLKWFIGLYVVVLVFISMYLQLMGLIGLIVVLIVIVALYRYWTYKNFGGMSGDLLGALCEGTELLLWMTALFFI